MLLTWDDYREWETDPSEIARIQDRHDQAQKRLDSMVNFEEKFQEAYLALESHADISGMFALLQGELPGIAGDNFNYVMLFFERILSEYTLNPELWSLYVGYTEEMCKSKEARGAVF